MSTGAVNLCKLGDANPDYRIGLANDITFHRFHLYFNWDWQKGATVANVTQNEYDFALNAPDYAKIVNCAAANGGSGQPEAVGACRANGLPNNLGVYMNSAAFIKLRELTLSYNLPSSLLRPLGRSFSSAAIQFEGRNLIDFNHYPGLDPEVSFISGSVNVGRNIDVTVFPPSRIFWFGLNLGL